MATTNVLARAWYIISSISFLLPRLLSSLAFFAPFQLLLFRSTLRLTIRCRRGAGHRRRNVCRSAACLRRLGSGCAQQRLRRFQLVVSISSFPPTFSRVVFACPHLSLLSVCLDVVFGQKLLCMFARWQYTLSILSPPLPYPNAYITYAYVCIYIYVYIYHPLM